MNNKKNLLRHFFWGNFDTGVILIFISFLIWEDTENMFTIAIAFMIPILINTIIDYYFSDLSDKTKRIPWIVVGNIGSAIALGLYGLAPNIYFLYLLIFTKSLFAKLYNTSLSPFIRETIEEAEYKDFVAKSQVQGNLGASIGGFALMTLYGFTQNITLIFIVSGAIELFSTVFLLRLKPVQIQLKKVVEEPVDLKWLKEITLIFAIESFGIALMTNRIIIFLTDTHHISMSFVGLVFFLVYGVSNMTSALIYKWFAGLSLRHMLIFSYLLQALTLIVMALMDNLPVILAMMFSFELINGVAMIYTSDQINKSLYSNIGKRLSKFRIAMAVATIAGQLIISQVWDRLGVNATFYFSSVVLIVLVVVIVVKQMAVDEPIEKPCEDIL